MLKLLIDIRLDPNMASSLEENNMETKKFYKVIEVDFLTGDRKVTNLFTKADVITYICLKKQLKKPSEGHYVIRAFVAELNKLDAVLGGSSLERIDIDSIPPQYWSVLR